jgi:adenine phosphoribosyltransferase
MSETGFDFKKYIRDIPDFPKPGIIFRDITPLLGDRAALAAAIEALANPFRNSKIDIVAAVEARGFIFGSAVAKALNAGFVPIRKKGKLPYETQSQSYDLEYGQDCLEVHNDAIPKGARVLMIDDLLATGGTMAAACRLINSVGGQIQGLTFLVELCFLNGREKIKNHNISSIVKFES